MPKIQKVKLKVPVRASETGAGKGRLRHDPDYFSSWREDRITEYDFERLAQEMIDWIEANENIFVIEQYLVGKKISYDTISDWAKKSDTFKKAYDYTKMVIFIRREERAMEHKLDSNYVKFSNPLYSKQWVELERWRSQLKAYEEKAKLPEVVIVKTPTIPTIGETE